MNDKVPTGDMLDIDGGAPFREQSQITLRLLEALHDQRTIGQRALAEHLGIALGLVNSYVRRCLRHGYIKVQQIPRKRYAYYLTPKGFAEKSRLAAEYLSMSLEFFRCARIDCVDAFIACHQRRWLRVALWGVGDLCEIALLSERPPDLKVVGIVAPDSDLDEFKGIQVVRDFACLPPVDAVILVDLAQALDAREQILRHIAPDNLVVPRLIKLPPINYNAYSLEPTPSEW